MDAFSKCPAGHEAAVLGLTTLVTALLDGSVNLDALVPEVLGEVGAANLVITAVGGLVGLASGVDAMLGLPLHTTIRRYVQGLAKGAV